MKSTFSLPLAAIAMTLAVNAFAQGRDAPGEWTLAPRLLPAMARGGDRTVAILRPLGIDVQTVTVHAGDGPENRRNVSYPVTAEGARIQSAAPRVGNYHWVTARQESEDGIRVASTARYFGNPGAAPTDLLKQVRHELEIIPDPLPREHGSYRESEKWRFLVRLHGRPLAGQPVTLETEFGSRSTVLTDAAGFATVLFPRDFKPATAVHHHGGGHAGPRAAAFVLTTAREDDGHRYLTAFNHTYREDGDRDKSLGWGSAFGLAGMLAATPLLRRRKDKGDSRHV